MGSQPQQAMAKVVLVILSLIIRDVVGSNSFDHVPEKCRARHYGHMYDYDSYDSSQLMTDIVDDFLELDLLSLNLTIEAFCNMDFWYFHSIKGYGCSKHYTLECEDENGDLITEPDYDDEYRYMNCRSRYSTESKSIYWFLVNIVEGIEKGFERWRKYSECEEEIRYRGPTTHNERQYYSDLERSM